MHGMKLIEGEGNTYDSRGKALEGDRFNTVFIVVCNSCLHHRNVRNIVWIELLVMAEAPDCISLMLQSTSPDFLCGVVLPQVLLSQVDAAVLYGFKSVSRNLWIVSSH